MAQPACDNTVIRVYPAPAGAVLRNEYGVRVRVSSPAEGSLKRGDMDRGIPGGSGHSWRSVPVYRVKVDMHNVRESSMCYFDFEGRIEVEVTVNRFYYIYRADIRPAAMGITARVEPRRLTFELDRAANLSVELNRERHCNLQIFAGNVEEDEQKADIVVNGSLSHPDTIGSEVNERIEATLALGKERALVHVRPGYHYLEDGVWRIPSHTDAIIEGGAVLEGSLVIDHAEDVRVRGRGVLYLADFKRFAGTNGVVVTFSKDVSIANLMLINPPHYSVFMGAANGVTIQGVKSFSCEGWSDGVDMMACDDVDISDCFLRTSDDCIAVYGSRWQYRGGSRHVNVRRCTLWADVAHPMMIGTHGDHEHDGDVLEDINFDDIDVLEQNEYQPGYLGVMAIGAGDKNIVRNVRWKHIRIERISHGRVLDIETRWNKDYNPAPGRLVENITIEDVDVLTGGDEEASLITGFDDEHPVRNVTIRNMRRDGRTCLDASDANIVVNAAAKDVRLGE